MPSTSPPIRLRAPLDLLGAMPHLLGFVPRSSLVVLCLDDANRANLTARADLPDGDDTAAFADDMAAHVARSGAVAVAMVVYTEEEASPFDVHTWASTAVSVLPRRLLVEQLAARLRRNGCGVAVAMLVRGGRYFNYLCDDPCCSADGEPLPATLTPAASHVAAQTVLEGRVVHADRSALTDRVACRATDASHAALFERTDFAVTTSWLADGLEPGRRTTTALMAHVVSARLPADHDALAGYAARWHAPLRLAGLVEGDRLSADGVARLVIGLHDKQARDSVATHGLDVPPGVIIDVLCELAQATPDRFAAPVCTLVAWLSCLVGDGALANVALERALASRPDYEMAQLLASGLSHQMGPDAVREILVSARRDLEGADARRAVLSRPRRRRAPRLSTQVDEL